MSFLGGTPKPGNSEPPHPLMTSHLGKWLFEKMSGGRRKIPNSPLLFRLWDFENSDLSSALGFNKIPSFSQGPVFSYFLIFSSYVFILFSYFFIFLHISPHWALLLYKGSGFWTRILIVSDSLSALSVQKGLNKAEVVWLRHLYHHSWEKQPPDSRDWSENLLLMHLLSSFFSSATV